MFASKIFSGRLLSRSPMGGVNHPISNRVEQLNGIIHTFSDPPLPSQFLLRGRNPNPVDLCPKYPNSIAPILFHLPNRTIDRILESIRPEYIGPLFAENGRNGFGTNVTVLRTQLPRWRVTNDTKKARKYLLQISHLVVCKSHSIPEHLLSELIQTTGTLVDSNLLPGEAANEIIKELLPICLDKLSLSRKDLYNIVYGLNRIPITAENAIVFPMISNFAHWYLSRNRFNRNKRRRAVFDHLVPLE